MKNGPLDFQPREPFHPLFGAMPKTPLMMEFQITKEYLGQDTHLVVPRAAVRRRCCDADTYAKGKGSTVAKVDRRLAARLRAHRASPAWRTSAPTATGRGSQFDQANWYAFGRLAWNHERSAARRSPTSGSA